MRCAVLGCRGHARSAYLGITRPICYGLCDRCAERHNQQPGCRKGQKHHAYPIAYLSLKERMAA